MYRGYKKVKYFYKIKTYIFSWYILLKMNNFPLKFNCTNKVLLEKKCNIKNMAAISFVLK